MGNAPGDIEAAAAAAAKAGWPRSVGNAYGNGPPGRHPGWPKTVGGIMAGNGIRNGNDGNKPTGGGCCALRATAAGGAARTMGSSLDMLIILKAKSGSRLVAINNAN